MEDYNGSEGILSHSSGPLCPETDLPPLPSRTYRPSALSLVARRTLEQLQTNNNHTPAANRKQNDYVDLPINIQPKSAKVSGKNCNGKTFRSVSQVSQSATTLDDNQINLSRELGQHNKETAILTQPSSNDVGVIKDDFSDSGSITCPRCHKCRCIACRKGPKELPSRWICQGQVKCSADSCIDTMTCMCCVTGVFYHCQDSDPEYNESCDDHPCACTSRPHCLKRWLCIALMSVCLPCLCCYPPLHCMARGCTFCYNRSKRKGCRCDQQHKHLNSTKQLLVIENERSSGSSF